MFYTEKLMESRMIDCRQCQRLRRDRVYVRTPICHLSTIPMSLYAQLSRTLVYLSNMLASILVVSMCLSINSCRLWWEQRVVVKVKRADYAQCTLADDSRVKMILNCSEPQRRRRFTILFEPYQSIPRAPEYHPGGRYYFISKYTRNPAVANGSHVRCGVNFWVKQR